MKQFIHNLHITWSTSRGRDTYGYDICRLDDSVTGKRYKCIGGGYDMIGTVLADWFSATYQGALRKLVSDNKASLEDCGYTVPGYRKLREYYGLTVHPNNRVELDGACGVSSIISIIRACGFDVQWIGDRKGRTISYLVSCEVSDAEYDRLFRAMRD